MTSTAAAPAGFAGSPSKIPLPRSRLPVATSPAESTAHRNGPAPFVSRIPKAVSPERKPDQPYPGGSATFVRRISPPSGSVHDDDRGPRLPSSPPHHVLPHEAKRRSSDPSYNGKPATSPTKKTSAPSPSRIPVASGSKSR